MRANTLLMEPVAGCPMILYFQPIKPIELIKLKNAYPIYFTLPTP